MAKASITRFTGFSTAVLAIVIAMTFSNFICQPRNVRSGQRQLVIRKGIKLCVNGRSVHFQLRNRLPFYVNANFQCARRAFIQVKYTFPNQRRSFHYRRGGSDRFFFNGRRFRIVIDQADVVDVNLFPSTYT